MSFASTGETQIFCTYVRYFLHETSITLNGLGVRQIGDYCNSLFAAWKWINMKKTKTDPTVK